MATTLTCIGESLDRDEVDTPYYRVVFYRYGGITEDQLGWSTWIGDVCHFVYGPKQTVDEWYQNPGTLTKLVQKHVQEKELQECTVKMANL